MYVMKSIEIHAETKQKNNKTEEQSIYLMVYLNTGIILVQCRSYVQ
jgi:hypothetical protein